MKRYIYSSYYDKPHPYPYGSEEYLNRVEECMKTIPTYDDTRAVVNLGGTIYVIGNNGFVDQWVVDDWGHCGHIYNGGMWAASQDFLRDGGDIDLVTFTDKQGVVYTPQKSKKRILVTTPDGSEFELNRGQAENMFMSNNRK